MTPDKVHPRIKNLAVAWGEGMQMDMINTMKLGMEIQLLFNDLFKGYLYEAATIGQRFEQNTLLKDYDTIEQAVDDIFNIKQ